MNNDKPFIEIKESITSEKYARETYVNSKLHGVSLWTSKNSFSIFIYIFNENRYNFDIDKDSSLNSIDRIHTIYDLQTFDSIVDYKVINKVGKREHHQGYNFTREDLDYDKKIKENYDVIKNYEDTKDIFTRLDLFVYGYWEDPFSLTRELNQERAGKTLYGYLVQESMKETLGYTVPDDFMEKYVLQNEIAEKIIDQDEIEYPIKYIAGISVSYNDINQKMASAIVVMNIETQEIVDQAFYESDDITTLHIPDLFAYNEVPIVLKAYEKLTIKPHLIFCDGHGIEHPKNVGLATHLGIELNISTIGCPKKRIVGYYDKTALGDSRGDTQELLFDDKIVGKALRTQKNNNPLYVSIGHKISLETAIDWVLRTTINTRVPFIVQEAINITEQLIPKRIRYDFLDDEENQYGIII